MWCKIRSATQKMIRNLRYRKGIADFYLQISDHHYRNRIIDVLIVYHYCHDYFSHLDIYWHSVNMVS